MKETNPTDPLHKKGMRNNYKKQFRQQWHNIPAEDRRQWHRRGRRMFMRIFASFGLIMLLIVGGMGALALLLTRWAGGSDSITVYVWVAGMLAMLLLPAFAVFLGVRTFRRWMLPLAEVMRAADKVAQGDFSIRMGKQHRGDFGALAKAFNHMVTELELSDQRRRNLTADVAHELRTPLHIIQGNLEGVLDGVYDPSAEHIEATLDETRLLSRLIEDLRILSLAESGQLPLTREPVNLADLLADVETSFHGLATENDVALHVHSDDPLWVSIDYLRMTQVIHNLVGNALRHTAVGGEISVIGTSHPDQSEKVIITVQDTGSGIAPEDIPFIFDRFWRGDRARPHSGSTGLGLAISHQLVRAHGGTLTVESEVGVGSKFTIELESTDRSEQFV